jgi:glycerol-3-phosphate cytidylyltransferase
MKRNQSGKNNPNYKNGSHLRSPSFCPNCKKLKDSRAKLCRECDNKMKKNKHSINYKGITDKKYYCITCKKEITFGSGYYGTGKCQSCAAKKNGLPKCIDCGIELKRYNNIRCKKCNNTYLSGKNHPGFVPGLNRIYPIAFNPKIKEIIRKRDKCTCQLCGKRGIEVHHIDYNKNNLSFENLICLCDKCHPKTNWNREVWTSFFKTGAYLRLKEPIIIFTAGSFDLLHWGHVNILKQAKALGTYLVVGVSTDSLILQHKGMRPIICYKDRTAIIKELKIVDRVVKQTKLVDIEQFISLKADLFVVGDDWKNRKDNQGINWLRDNNKIAFIPYTRRLSSSKIKEKIINNAVRIIKAQVKR